MKVLIAAIILSASAVTSLAGGWNDQLTKQSRYYGVGWQSDGNHWSIEVILGKNGGQIAYPSIECTGKWDLTGQSEVIVQYRETIIDGIADCVSRGTVELEPQPNGRLLYTWKETPETVDARAILLPVTAERLTYMELLQVTLNAVDFDYLWPEFRE